MQVHKAFFKKQNLPEEQCTVLTMTEGKTPTNDSQSLA